MSKALDEAFERFGSVVSNLDLDRIHAAILGPDPMADYDFDDAKKCIWGAMERWLLQDLDNFSITSIEGKITKDNFKAYLDIKGSVLSKPKDKAFLPYANRKIISDWKSTGGGLDPKWAQRQTLSMQWREYCWAEGEVGLFIYRGIKRPGSDNKVVTREIILDPNEWVNDNSLLTELQVNAITGMRNFLITEDFPIWPMHMPDNCTKWGGCPYEDDCDKGTAPRWTPERRVMSYSRLKQFLDCPEQARRSEYDEANGVEDNGTAATRFGGAVHRGLAEVYSQVFGIPVSSREEIEEEKEEIE